MSEFTEHIENIIQYIPKGDDVLVTGTTIIKKGNDIIDTEEKTAINFVQTIVAVGPRVPKEEFKVGDIIDVNFNAIREIAEHAVFLNGNSEELYLLIPMRFIRGTVILGDPIVRTIDNLNLEENE